MTGNELLESLKEIQNKNDKVLLYQANKKPNVDEFKEIVETYLLPFLDPKDNDTENFSRFKLVLKNKILNAFDDPKIGIIKTLQETKRELEDTISNFDIKKGFFGVDDGVPTQNNEEIELNTNSKETPEALQEKLAKCNIDYSQLKADHEIAIPLASALWRVSAKLGNENCNKNKSKTEELYKTFSGTEQFDDDIQSTVVKKLEQINEDSCFFKLKNDCTVAIDKIKTDDDVAENKGEDFHGLSVFLYDEDKNFENTIGNLENEISQLEKQLQDLGVPLVKEVNETSSNDKDTKIQEPVIEIKTDDNLASLNEKNLEIIKQLKIENTIQAIANDEIKYEDLDYQLKQVVEIFEVAYELNPELIQIAPYSIQHSSQFEDDFNTFKSSLIGTINENEINYFFLKNFDTIYDLDVVLAFTDKIKSSIENELANANSKNFGTDITNAINNELTDGETSWLGLIPNELQDIFGLGFEDFQNNLTIFLEQPDYIIDEFHTCFNLKLNDPENDGAMEYVKDILKVAKEEQKVEQTFEDKFNELIEKFDKMEVADNDVKIILDPEFAKAMITFSLDNENKLDKEDVANLKLSGKALALDDNINQALNDLQQLQNELRNGNFSNTETAEKSLKNCINSINETSKKTSSLKNKIVDVSKKAFISCEKSTDKLFTNVKLFSNMKMGNELKLINNDLNKNLTKVNDTIGAINNVTVGVKQVKQHFSNAVKIIKGEYKSVLKPEPCQALVKPLVFHQKNLVAMEKWSSNAIKNIDNKITKLEEIKSQPKVSVLTKLKEKKQQMKSKEVEPSDLKTIELSFNDEVEKLAKSILKYLKYTEHEETLGNLDEIKANLTFGDGDKIKDVLANATNDKDNKFIKAISNFENKNYPKDLVLKVKDSKNKDEYIFVEKKDETVSCKVFDNLLNKKGEETRNSNTNIFKDFANFTNKDLSKLLSKNVAEVIDDKQFKEFLETKNLMDNLKNEQKTQAKGVSK